MMFADSMPPPEGPELSKLPEDGGAEFNRLVFESSPYLRQHARNPVDWWPWGEAAFAKARSEDKPVLLSIGYSTCHWCHVMAGESFEDGQVARVINKHFVPIKVDREERPDIDEVYMTATQLLSGSGGWPMTVFLTPDGKPFFAGTYFPKNDRAGRAGFLTVLGKLSNVWRGDRRRVERSADEIAAAIAGMGAGSPGKMPGYRVLDRACGEFAAAFDRTNGGFGSGTKFPMPQTLCFLLRQWRRDKDPETLAMAETTLASIRNGGLYDHIGHGIHRYSTDPLWELPHFEKMLYDQALYATALLDAYEATGNPGYAETARDVLGYVLRVLTAPEGGFYSAEDSQSNGGEGMFYVWTAGQIDETLGGELAAVFATVYQIFQDGNFHDEATGRKTGANIPRLRLDFDLAEGAEAWGLTPEALANQLQTARKMLFAAREKRPKPGLDDKVLTDWNGLMIAAMARAGRVLDEERFRTAAIRAGQFVLSHLRTPDGRLLKRWRAGKAGLPGHLEDYAFLIRGLIELRKTTGDDAYLREALALDQRLAEDFSDPEQGGFFMTSSRDDPLIVRIKKLYGGAIPSGNAMAGLNFLDLADLAGNESFVERFRSLACAFSGDIARRPSAFPVFLQALAEYFERRDP